MSSLCDTTPSQRACVNRELEMSKAGGVARKVEKLAVFSGSDKRHTGTRLDMDCHYCLISSLASSTSSTSSKYWKSCLQSSFLQFSGHPLRSRAFQFPVDP